MGQPNRTRRPRASDVGLLKRLPEPTGWFSTGCTLLDAAISDHISGGIAGGRITHIFGPPSSGKSLLACEPLGAAQRLGGLAVFLDVERTLDGRRAALFGLDVNAGPEHFQYGVPSTVENLFDTHLNSLVTAREKLKNPPPCVVAIDSLSALPTEKELAEGLDKDGYKLSRAKQLSLAFRKYIFRLGVANTSLLFLDQTRQDVGIFGGGVTVSGGEALKFYASTRVELKHVGRIKNKYDQAIGVIIKFRVIKNKVAPPFREGLFRVIFDYGIDDVGSNLIWYKTFVTSEAPDKTEKRKSSGYEWRGLKAASLDKMITAIETENLEGQLAVDVMTAWGKYYEVPARKPRDRGVTREQ